MTERMTSEAFRDKYGQNGERKTAHKYHAKRCACDHGHIHASRKEAVDCEKVEVLRKAGEFTEVKTQVRFPLYAFCGIGLAAGGKPIKVCDHIVDKLVTRKDGTKEVIETKGFATSEWILKRKLFEANYPNIVYTVWR